MVQTRASQNYGFKSHDCVAWCMPGVSVLSLLQQDIHGCDIYWQYSTRGWQWDQSSRLRPIELKSVHVTQCHIYSCWIFQMQWTLLYNSTKVENKIYHMLVCSLFIQVDLYGMCCHITTNKCHEPLRKAFTVIAYVTPVWIKVLSLSLKYLRMM